MIDTLGNIKKWAKNILENPQYVKSPIEPETVIQPIKPIEDWNFFDYSKAYENLGYSTDYLKNSYGYKAFTQEGYNFLSKPEVVNAYLHTNGFPQFDKTNTLLSNLLDLQKAEQNSFYNKYMKPISSGVTSLATLGSLWLGFRNYSLAKKQLSMAREQWNMTRDELNRIRSAREKLTKSYFGE